jgi:hypothetical protein
MEFAYWLCNVDIMRVDDVCNVGGMMAYVWTIGGVIACTDVCAVLVE